ncbi:hypothetical protein RhiirA5_434531 [Rhizophagus irregularis]|uniref:Uncharacterized protein n=1 Tax=Rhizophagus irregularis TaxID=588596 RepID=A0A2I1FBN6_9GLOM|nr:hypothetical protein RhiirA5_434531 [Rhizophagus irregularis]PKC54510.1 hypothetical protein RhiirA1_477199 [Rhizophagus irregularis]PKY31773.1 hypothetical protein RhiirB3_449552 [Rhizophagus irregularis]
MYTVKHFEERLKPLCGFHPKFSDLCNTEINKKLSAEINNHYTVEIALINARIEIFIVEAQSILDRINNIEQTVNDLYEEAWLVNHSRLLEEQNETETINSAINSLANVSFKTILCGIWTRFKHITDRIMTEKKLTLDEVCNRIAIEISDYGIGKICAQTVKNFYHKNNSHSKTLDKISVWV